MSNGTKFALGAAAILALGASLGSRGSRFQCCESCGVPMGGRGSRSVFDEDALSAIEAKRLKRRLAQTEFVDPSFYVQRTDAPAWFVATVADVDRIVKRRNTWMREQWRRTLQAMGAKKVSWARKDGLRPTTVTGRLTHRSAKAQALIGAQLAELDRLEVGKVSMRPDGRLTREPAATVEQYLDNKSSSINKARDNEKLAAWIQRAPKAYYAAQLTVNRAWTIHVLTTLGFTSAASRSPLVAAVRGTRGLLETLTYQLILPRPVPEVQEGDAYQVGAGPLKVQGGQASIAMFDRSGRQMALMNVSDVGTMGGFATGRRHVPVLSKTSKMSAPSFSLPAGSPKAAGTCVMAGVEVQAQHPRELMICNSCYATKANYAYPESMSATHVRLEWVKQALDREVFADGMAAAISCYARFTTEGGYARKDGKYQPSTRATQELGLWDARSRKLIAPSTSRTKAPPTVVTRITQYAALGVDVKSTAELYEAQGTPDGAVAGFFRIHDAGDFTVPRKQLSYISAWSEVCARFPYVHFWVPTRVWATGVRRGRLDEAQGRWVREGLRNGMRLRPTGSASRLQRIGGRLAERVAAKLDLVLPPELRGLTATDLLENHAGEVEMGSAASPGEKDGVLLEGAAESTPSALTYVPNERIVRALSEAMRVARNLAVRPSSLYVKTPENPAFIPTIRGLANGSGVNVAWGSVWAWKTALSAEGVRGESRLRDTAKAWAAEEGHSPDDYVPVFDNQGRQAYQCPVYSYLPVEDSRGRPVLDKDGQPKVSEAKSCQAAGCRACWLAPSVPITYGYH
jgi:hypothetical protein